MLNQENDQALKQFWINCCLQSRLTLKHGWRLTVDGWRLSSCSHIEQGLWGRRSVWHTKSSDLSITPLHETKTRVTVDGYRLNSWTPVPTENRGSERSRLCDTWGSELFIIALQEAESDLQQPWFLVSWTYVANACTITYLTRWKERGTIRFIPELVHNLASALAALCASLAQWLERGALPMSLLAVRFSNPAWGRIFREISCFSPLNLGIFFRYCVLGQGDSAPNASLEMITRGDRDDMCTISSKSWNSCRVVCSPGSWNVTRKNRSCEQGVKYKVGW